MTDLQCDAVVIGAGVVGLAIARALAQAGLDTVILEKESGIGMETSSRNSEVIHAGLYYPAGSLKARLCVEGRARLYDFCRTHGVAHRQVGKWVVACAAAEESALHALKARAAANGVTDLVWIDGGAARDQEPELRAAAILSSPSTGILDSHALMLALLGDAEDAGAILVRRARVTHVAPQGNGFRLSVDNDGARQTLQAGRLINSAGLWAWSVARSIEGLPAASIPPCHFAKGHYASVGATPFRRLIYPLPDAGGLGVHLTLDLQGQGRLGPDARWLTEQDPAGIDFGVTARDVEGFAAAARRWWPALDESRLRPAYAGVRPRIRADSGGDFRIDGSECHGLPGLVNLFGIDSPGLTACLAIAAAVTARLGL